MKTKLISYLISGALAFGIIGLIVAAAILLGAMVAAPSKAQQHDSIPSDVPALVDSAAVMSPIDSAINVVTEKAKKAGENFDKIESSVTRVNDKLNQLQTRQARILMLITPVKLPVVPQRPLPPREYQVYPDTPQIQPVEIHKAGWWKRTFRQD